MDANQLSEKLFYSVVTAIIALSKVRLSECMNDCKVNENVKKQNLHLFFHVYFVEK